MPLTDPSTAREGRGAPLALKLQAATLRQYCRGILLLLATAAVLLTGSQSVPHTARRGASHSVSHSATGSHSASDGAAPPNPQAVFTGRRHHGADDANPFTTTSSSISTGTGSTTGDSKAEPWASGMSDVEQQCCRPSGHESQSADESADGGHPIHSSDGSMDPSPASWSPDMQVRLGATDKIKLWQCKLWQGLCVLPCDSQRCLAPTEIHLTF